MDFSEALMMSNNVGQMAKAKIMQKMGHFTAPKLGQIVLFMERFIGFVKIFAPSKQEI